MIGPETPGDNAESYRCDERAVSDVLAFVLVFSIIITSVGLVYVFGMGALGDAQVSEQNRNAERGFETLTVTFNDLQNGRGEERLSQINPRGGRVSVEDGTRLNVTVDGVTRYERSVGSLDYSNEGTRISYELGATFRADDGSSVMVRPPQFVCRTSGTGPARTVLSYTNLTGTSPSSVTTSSTLRIRATNENREVHYPINRTGTDTRAISDDVTVRIEDSAHADAWERYFEDGDWNVDPYTDVDVGRVQATCDADVAYVRETELEIELL